jgi:hypothetical protein
LGLVCKVVHKCCTSLFYDFKRKFGAQEEKLLLALFKIQNGGENQDGRQTLKCS